VPGPAAAETVARGDEPAPPLRAAAPARAPAAAPTPSLLPDAAADDGETVRGAREVIISVVPGLDPAALATIANANGFDLVRVFASVSGARLRLRPGHEMAPAMAALGAHPLIDAVSPNSVIRAASVRDRLKVESGYAVEGSHLKVRWDGDDIVFLSDGLDASCEQAITAADAAWAQTDSFEAAAVLAEEAYAPAYDAQQDNLAAVAAAKTAMNSAKGTRDATKKCYEAKTCTLSAYDAAIAAYEAAIGAYNDLRDRQSVLDDAEDDAKHARDDAARAYQDAVSAALHLEEDAQHEVWDFEKHAAGTVPSLAHLQWPARFLDLKDVVDYGISGSGVTIAVLDTGVAFESWDDGERQYAVAPDLAHVTFVAPWDVLDGDAHPNDVNGHGTQMATLIAGVGASYAIAPNVRIMPVRVLDDARVGTEADLIEGLLWASCHGADVINMSLAFPDGYMASPPLDRALAVASASGAVLVAAAGNAGVDSTPYPAAAREVIAVGAYEPTDLRKDLPRGERASYSNGDTSIDLVAPMGSLDKDSDRDGFPDAAFSMSFDAGHPLDFGYYFTAGTSGAAAQVSAVVALVLEAGDAPEQVAGRLHRTTQRYDMSNDPIVAGMGAGQVDAGEAVKEAIDNPFEAGCGSGDLFVNPIGVITRKDVGKARAGFIVEIIDGAGLPVRGARLLGRVRGTTNELVDEKSNGDGVIKFKTHEFDPRLHPEGLAWTFDIKAVEVDDPDCGMWVRRPVVFTRIDQATLLLFANFGAGLGSSSIIAHLDPSAGTLISAKLDKAPYVGTYVHRTFGTGLGSSSIIGIYDDVYMRGFKLLDSAVVIRTFGTGLGSSSIVADFGYLAPSRLSAIPQTDLIVRSYANGTGLGSSSIIAGGLTVTWDQLLSGLNNSPGIMYFDYGLGRSTFAMVFDVGLMNPSLLASDATALTSPASNGASPDGMGLGSSSRVATFSLTLLTSLGFDAQTSSYLQQLYATGISPDATPLVRTYALYRTGAPITAWTPWTPEPATGSSFGQAPMPAQP
jgi:hypothetical protein